MELEPALAVLTDLAAVRGEVVPDGDGAFAAEQTRRLFMELGEGLPERDALAAPGLIDGGMLAGGGLTRDEIAALRANAERARARAEAASAGEIEDQINAGGAGALEVEAAHRSGQIPESAATRLTGLARNAAAGREKAAMSATRIADVMLGRGEAGDPDDPETRASVEAFTESTLPDPMAMVPAETAARIVQRTGILPSRVAVSLKAGLAEGADPARRNEALVTVMLLKSQAPGALEAEIARLHAADPLKPLTTAQDLATYDIAGSFVGAGIEPDEAFRLANVETEAREAGDKDEQKPDSQVAVDLGRGAFPGGDETEGTERVDAVPADNDAEAGILPEGEDEAAARGAEGQDGEGSEDEFDALGGEGLGPVPDPPSGEEAEAASPTLLDRVLNRIAEAAGQEFEGEIGISQETFERFREAGLFRTGEAGPMETVRAFNEILVVGGAAAGDLAMRALFAVEAGLIGGTGQVAQELGETETGARRLERDLAILGTVAGRGRRPKKGRKAGRKTKTTDTIGESFEIKNPPAPKSLPELVARDWYLTTMAEAKRNLSTDLPLEQQARWAFASRNKVRTTARDAMKNRSKAAEFERTRPNETWEQVVAKCRDAGFRGDKLFECVIASAFRSDQKVNKDLGFE